jgi:hypothetical protein
MNRTAVASAGMRRMVEPRGGDRSASVSKVRLSGAAQGIRPPRSRMPVSQGLASGPQAQTGGL